ncbi:MAG: 50S ribosomal protein L18 [Rickettsiales bacterium]|nr:50S ribosomal protein L18 [Rickettsiales bacterium]
MSKSLFIKRKERTRAKLKKVNRSSLPRLSVWRSNNNIYVQIIDDLKGYTVVSVNTLQKDLKIDKGNTVDAAKKVGSVVAASSIKQGIKQVVFDKSGYKYHGRVKAVADAAREAGLII